MDGDFETGTSSIVRKYLGAVGIVLAGIEAIAGRISGAAVYALL